MNVIENIYRFPIKGLTGQTIDIAKLEPGEVIEGDREYAFARQGVEFDPDHPSYLKKTHFLALVRDERLAELNTIMDPVSNRLTIIKNQKIIAEWNLKGDEKREASEFFKAYLDMPEDEGVHLVRAAGGTKKHSFSDVPDKAVSFINLNSIKHLEGKIGNKVDPIRFRGNVYFSGEHPWIEFDWIGKEVRIGKAVLKVFKRTKRCAATAVNPETGVRDMNIPKALKNYYDHMDMGIYAEVLVGGTIKIGDRIEVL